MIILRNKDFSLAPTRLVAKFNKTVRRMSPMQAKRSAIQSQNKAINKIASGKTAVEKAVLNPGENIVRPLVKDVVSKPITGTATAVLPGGTLIQGTPLPKYEEMLLDKVGVGKFTRKLSNKVDTKFGPYIEQGTNSMIRGLSMI